MKAVILAGGFGTRLSEETELKPKPMVEIGGKPILWHVMQIYSAFGIHDFIICCGYKGYVIKEYFSNYFLHNSDVTFDIPKNKMEVHQNTSEPWRVTLVDTGTASMTGGRLKRVADYIGKESFCFTYGDGVSGINIKKLISFHQSHGKMATMTIVNPPGRYGAVDIKNDTVINFREKLPSDSGWINGGFFVLEPNVINLIQNDETVFEQDTLPRLAQQKELKGYKYTGFWHAVDTLRELNYLNSLYQAGRRPWLH